MAQSKMDRANMEEYCFQCGLKLTPHRNGVNAIKYSDSRPLEIYHCDLSICPECGVITCTGFGGRPISAIWQEDWPERLDQVLAIEVENPHLVVHLFDRKIDKDKYNCP
jgi:hypothetical protein